jgi:outer membrane protein assembly factor BamE
VSIRSASVLQHFQNLDARESDFESGVSYVLTFQSGNLRSVLSLLIEYDWTLSPILRNHIMPKCLTVITYCLCLFLVGCSTEKLKESLPGVYRLDIHQGNIVSQQMVDQLRPGMTKRQVAFIMGSPLIVDPFHDNRWDYLYSNEPGGKPRMQKRITLVFGKDELIGLQGDFRPGNLPEIDPDKDVTIDIPKIEREKSLWEKIKGLFGKSD